MISEGISEFEELKLKAESAKALLYLADFYRDSDQRQKAQISFKKAQEMFRDMGMDYWLGRTEEALEKLKAR